MRILVAGLSHETNTFSSERCDFERFAPNGWALGKEVLELHTGMATGIGGMIEAAQEQDVQLFPVMDAGSSGPLITKECIDKVCGKLFEGIEEGYKEGIDGICLNLHGAGCAETTDDLEGYILENTRRIVGPDLPVTVALDLHGNITEAMVKLSNGLFGIKEYPHIDCKPAGKLAMETLIEMIRTGTKIHTALAPLPMFVTPSLASTLSGPLSEVKKLILAEREREEIVDVSFFHGFPYQDRKNSRASVVVLARDAEVAKETALRLAADIWNRRQSFTAETLSAEQAVDKALELAGSDGYVVINEASDNPGGGAPGDGTHLLRALIERGAQKTVFAFINDPGIARQAFEAGVGGTVSGLLGGKTDDIHGKPIELKDARVLAISDGNIKLRTPMAPGFPVEFGKTARILVGGVEVIVIEILATQMFDDALFEATGAFLKDYEIACVKSTTHFRAYFEPRAKAIVPADPPGIHTANFSQLTYSQIQRPIFPLEADTGYVPTVIAD